jgi:serine/threonine-protein kinase HSL1 (negative regulator of Swe1 kinase)
VTDANVLLHHNPETANTTDTEYDGKPLPPPPRGGGKSQNWFARVFQLKPATRVIALNTSTTKARKYIHKTMREWKKWGMEDVYLDKDKRVIYGSVGEVNRTSPRSNIFEYIMEEAQLTQLIRSAESSTGPIFR